MQKNIFFLQFWVSQRLVRGGGGRPTFNNDNKYDTYQDNDDDDLFASDAVAELTLITEELFLTAEWFGDQK